MDQWLGGSYDFGLPSLWISEGKVVKMVQFNKKFTKRYWLCDILVEIGDKLPIGSFYIKTYPVIREKIRQWLRIANKNTTKLPIILQQTNSHKIKCYMAAHTFSDPLFW